MTFDDAGSLDRVQLPEQHSEQLAANELAAAIRLREYLSSTIHQRTQTHPIASAQAQPVGRTFADALAREMQRDGIDIGRVRAISKGSYNHTMDQSINRFGLDSPPAHRPSVTSEALANSWHEVVGRDRAATSQPIGIVENQLIIEITREAEFSGHDMSRAISALGRDDVDRVAIRVVETLSDQPAVKRSQNKGMRR
jgi:hypothetical protein